MSAIKGFIGETLIYGFANIFSRVFAFTLIPIYHHYLGSDDYSNVIMLLSIFSVLTYTLALNSGVFFYYYDWERESMRKKIFTSWFYYQIIGALILIVLLASSSPFLKELFVINAGNSGELQLCISLLGLMFIPYVFNITNINYFRIQRKPKAVVVIVFLEALFTLALVSLALIILNWGLVGVIIAQIVARSIVSIFFYRLSKFYLDWRHFSGKILKRLVSFAWPFFVISAFMWMIGSIDKFVGAGTLSDKSEVAILALAMQLTIPIVMIADMIRMAIGPYMMSIKREKNAEQSYQQIFDLSVFSALIVLIGIIGFSPLLTLLLTDETYLRVIFVIPFIGLAQILSMMSTQLSINFSLRKKTTYILYATVLGGTTGVLINFLFMKDYGFIVSGIAQIVSFLIMTVYLYYFGKKLVELKINPLQSILLIGITCIYIVWVFLNGEYITRGNYLWNIIFGGICAIVIAAIFYIQFKRSRSKN